MSLDRLLAQEALGPRKARVAVIDRLWGVLAHEGRDLAMTSEGELAHAVSDGVEHHARGLLGLRRLLGGRVEQLHTALRAE